VKRTEAKRGDKGNWKEWRKTDWGWFIVTCPQVHFSTQMEPLNLTPTFGMAFRTSEPADE